MKTNELPASARPRAGFTLTVRPASLGLPAPEVRAKTRFGFVSFDAERDSPVELHAYRGLPLDAAGWTLLLGGAEDVQARAASGNPR